MIISKITSGLGNQLFQYAMAKNLALRSNTSLYLDLSYFKYTYATDTPRTYKLSFFNICPNHFDHSPLFYFAKATKLFPNRTFKPIFELIKERQFNFDPDVLNTKSLCVTLDGFWQSEKYFDENSELIRKELVFKPNSEADFITYQRKINTTETPISIHIRRGDYVNHPEFSEKFGFVGLDYYQRAVDYVREHTPRHRFFIFSDDVEWVRYNFQLGDEAVYVQNVSENGDVSDLQLMSLCHHHIIANSSFSWWGAWLNPRKDKVVVAPKQWYKNQPTWDTKDLLPATWIRL